MKIFYEGSRAGIERGIVGASDKKAYVLQKKSKK
jgi:hypothetical protein